MIQSDQNSTATRQWLLELYEGKKSKQPGYSLRQFGRFLGVSPATISQVLSGKRSIGRRVAQVIASNTGMSSLESRRFLTAAATEAYFMQDQGAAAVERLLLDHETFKVLSEWYHFAILSLGDTRNNVDSVPFISAQLDITPMEARGALDRLEKLGIIRRSGGRFRQTVKPISTSEDRRDIAIRKYHRQNLQNADLCLNRVGVADRDISSITMAIDKSKLPRAKELIRTFRKELCALLESGPKEEVFTLAIQLFPAELGRYKEPAMKEMQ